MDSFNFDQNSTLPGFENSLSGTVKWFNIKSGFGFITPSDGSDDIFVHRSSIIDEGIRDLNDGEKVTYKVVLEDGKNKAANVHVEASADGQPPQKPRKWPEGVTVSEGKQIGQVKWFDVTKGFGFLTPLNGGEDVFVHKSSVSGSSRSGKTLMEGEEVEFSIENDDNDKPKAVGVTGPNGEAVQGVPQRRYGGARSRGPRRNNSEE
ncbi:hypothetical protein TrVE_jg5578 [Triparma verrucosa]|uniref:CSD domain-containing protein n=2 Tax=Triparma TaxID=722752 RepID=A0A9W7BAT4_9STRA|nr:hypothetical protein TrVE_jg5578 [Triparma verrucosa]GMH86997.1 hypothetical protein TrST_g1499 [Triparma strigata]|eukprot:CAMPEP_0182499226 /NCGR_PEP_ID=MMETSP1321-20130603/7363_1 /TAXON_ID=91990 /ORGANISM="Bolidomonas sp., Strain RCC1657" /LENGTH=205 /DNA_ID=CAMNT_0024703383 /DNA_START=25 /DNA_END=642 /DNA_ORIENTATION=-